MKKDKRYLLIVLCLPFLFGCNDFLEEKDMPRVTVDFYQTEQGVESAVNAAYSYLRWGASDPNSASRFNTLTEHGTDLFTQGEGNSVSYNTYNAQLSPDRWEGYEMWKNHYQAINTANLALDGITSSSDLSESRKKLASAEMLFMRGFFYFELVQQFGSIPLVLEASYEVRTSFTRTPVADIYNQIIADLAVAVNDLPETPASKGRATKYAAAHLLAKVYLTRGSAVSDNRGQQPSDFENALSYAEMVINSGKHQLEKNFANLWDIDNQGNKEIIFAVQFSDDLVYNGSGNCLHLYWGSWYEDQTGMMRDLENGRPYRVHRATNKTMLELFDRKNDSRFYKSFKWVYYANKANPVIAIGDTAIYYSVNPPKQDSRYAYFAWDKETPTNNNRYYPPLLKYFDSHRASYNETRGTREWVRMRLGETYLLAAEAAGRKGDFNKAAEYINVIRERAAWHEGESKMPQYWVEEGGEINDTRSTYDEIKVTSSMLSPNFVDFILDERGRELLGETNRWEDLVRCEKLEEFVKKNNPDAQLIKPHHKLRPIPQKHIDRLSPRGTDEEEQNPGYY